MHKKKLSEKKMKHAKHGREVKSVFNGRVVIRDGKTAAETIIVGRSNAHGIKLGPQRFQVQVNEVITEAQKRKLERSGIKIVAVNDMVKRREENVAAFRKMGKPGYAFTEGFGGKVK